MQDATEMKSLTQGSQRSLVVLGLELNLITEPSQLTQLACVESMQSFNGVQCKLIVVVA